jgi:hypothetical protein
LFPFSDGLSIEKLEEHLNILKENFKEKQEMVESMKIACMPKISLYPTGDERSRRSTQVLVKLYTDKKEKIVLIYKEIQKGAVAKSFMTKGPLIYD